MIDDFRLTIDDWSGSHEGALAIGDCRFTILDWHGMVKIAAEQCNNLAVRFPIYF